MLLLWRTVTQLFDKPEYHEERSMTAQIVAFVAEQRERRSGKREICAGESRPAPVPDRPLD